MSQKSAKLLVVGLLCGFLISEAAWAATVPFCAGTVRSIREMAAALLQRPSAEVDYSHTYWQRERPQKLEDGEHYLLWNWPDGSRLFLRKETARIFRMTLILSGDSNQSLARMYPSVMHDRTIVPETVYTILGVPKQLSPGKGWRRYHDMSHNEDILVREGAEEEILNGDPNFFESLSPLR